MLLGDFRRRQRGGDRARRGAAILLFARGRGRGGPHMASAYEPAGGDPARAGVILDRIAGAIHPAWKF